MLKKAIQRPKKVARTTRLPTGEGAGQKCRFSPAKQDAGGLDTPPDMLAQNAMTHLFGIGREPDSRNIGMTTTIMRRCLLIQRTCKRSRGAAMAEDLYEIFPEMVTPAGSCSSQSGLT